MTAAEALNKINDIMSSPYDWSADTLDEISVVMMDMGYVFPTEEELALEK